MKNPKNKTVMQGAVTLGAAAIAVKAMGALFKMPLFHLLGGDGMGYFSTAYSLFNPICALAVTGFPTAVSKMVSEYRAGGMYRDVLRVMKISVRLFACIGTAGFLLLYFGAKSFSGYIGNPGAYLSVAAISPSVLFCCMMSVFRGYYVGLNDMLPSAISQVLEGAARVCFGLLGAWAGARLCSLQYTKNGRILGLVLQNTQQLQTLKSICASAGAVLGVTLSTAVGALYLIFLHKKRSKTPNPILLMQSPAPKGFGYHLKSLAKLALPVCLSGAALNLTSLIDLASVINRLAMALSVDAFGVLNMYAGMIPAGKPLDELPNYLYGSYQCALTLFNLVPAVTSVLGVSALPALAGAWATKQKQGVINNIHSVLRVTSLVSFPAGLGMCVLAQPLMQLVFGSRPQEAAIGAMALALLGPSVAAVSLSVSVNSMLQAVGKEYVPLFLMLAGGAVKLVSNYFFVGLPQFNMMAAPFGTLLCYLVISTGGIVALTRHCQTKANSANSFLKPMLGAVGCALSAGGCFAFLQRFFGHLQGVCTVLSVIVGGVVYLVLVFWLKAVKKEDINVFPGGEKLVQLLEKHNLIG